MLVTCLRASRTARWHNAGLEWLVVLNVTALLFAIINNYNNDSSRVWTILFTLNHSTVHGCVWICVWTCVCVNVCVKKYETHLANPDVSSLAAAATLVPTTARLEIGCCYLQQQSNITHYHTLSHTPWCNNNNKHNDIDVIVSVLCEFNGSVSHGSTTALSRAP